MSVFHFPNGPLDVVHQEIGVVCSIFVFCAKLEEVNQPWERLTFPFLCVASYKAMNASEFIYSVPRSTHASHLPPMKTFFSSTVTLDLFVLDLGSWMIQSPTTVFSLRFLLKGLLR